MFQLVSSTSLFYAYHHPVIALWSRFTRRKAPLKRCRRCPSTTPFPDHQLTQTFGQLDTFLLQLTDQTHSSSVCLFHTPPRRPKLATTRLFSSLDNVRLQTGVLPQLPSHEVAPRSTSVSLSWWYRSLDMSSTIPLGNNLCSGCLQCLQSPPCRRANQRSLNDTAGSGILEGGKAFARILAWLMLVLCMGRSSSIARVYIICTSWYLKTLISRVLECTGGGSASLGWETQSSVFQIPSVQLSYTHRNSYSKDLNKLFNSWVNLSFSVLFTLLTRRTYSYYIVTSTFHESVIFRLVE